MATLAPRSLLQNITYDDFASAFNYSSGWTYPDTSPDGFPNGDSYLLNFLDSTQHSTTTANATVSFKFSGSAIYLYASSAGSWEITMDPSPTADSVTAVPASTNSSTYDDASVIPFHSATGLLEGEHEMVIRNIEGSFLVDYVQVTTVAGAEGATLTNTTVENDDARLTYSGEWDGNSNARFSGGTSNYTNAADGSVSLSFNGSAVYVFGDTVDDHGLVTFDLDGTPYTYNAYTNYLKYGTLVFGQGGLNSSEHTLTITNVPGSEGTFFDLDSIVYTTPSAFAEEDSASALSSTSAGASSTPSSSTSSSSPTSASGTTAPSSTPTSAAGKKTASVMLGGLALMAASLLVVA